MGLFQLPGRRKHTKWQKERRSRHFIAGPESERNVCNHMSGAVSVPDVLCMLEVPEEVQGKATTPEYLLGEGEQPV